MAEYTKTETMAEDGKEPTPARSDKEILDEAKERLKQCIDDSDPQRTKQKDDLLFSALEQWPSGVRAAREGDPNGARPCLTIDQINQYIVQVVNDMRQNRPAIKVRPVDDNADVDTAEVFQGVIRQIEDQSQAQIPYMSAGESAVRVGEGYFRILTEYEDDKSFNQVIKIRRVPDMFCVYLGPHIMPDGSDAEYGFVFEDYKIEKFKRLFPGKKWQSTDFDALADYRTYWGGDKMIRVCEYFYFEYEKATLLFLADGTTVPANEYDGPEENIQDKRETRLRKMKWCKLTGVEVLEKRDWAGKYIPIVKVIGKELWIDGERICWGLVRPAKDTLRMYNYMASTIVEKIALSPKAPFVGATGQFEGLEDRWKTANTVNYSYLEYKPITVDGLSVPAPQRQQPTPIEVGMYQFLQTAREDVQSSLGMFRASLGKEQPNQSGKAILALTRESDTGTFHFSDNMRISIEYCGRILIDLIPKIYDTEHVRKILGDDGKTKTVKINPQQEESKREIKDEDGIKTIYNLNVGSYDVTSTVGPSYNTKRMEAATLFADLAMNAKDPSLALVANYFAIKNSDFNGSEKAAEMLEKLAPPGLFPKEGEPPVPPEVAQKMQQMGQALQQLSQENEELKSGTKEAQMKVAAAQQESQAKLALQAQTQQQELEFERQKAAAQLQLEREKANAQIELEKVKAAAQLEIERMKINAAADGDVEMAINKIKNLAQIHETKIKGVIAQKEAEQEGEASGAAEGQKSADQLGGEFTEALKQMVDGLQAKKKITITRQDGQITGATVG